MPAEQRQGFVHDNSGRMKPEGNFWILMSPYRYGCTIIVIIVIIIKLNNNNNINNNNINNNDYAFQLMMS